MRSVDYKRLLASAWLCANFTTNGFEPTYWLWQNWPFQLGKPTKNSPFRRHSTAPGTCQTIGPWHAPEYAVSFTLYVEHVDVKDAGFRANRRPCGSLRRNRLKNQRL